MHNEEEYIGAFIKMLLRVLEDGFEHSEIICVNDHSEDGSLEKIREAGAEAADCGISVIHMSCFHGLETAMNAGIDLAIGDFVFEFDSAEADFDSSVIMDVYARSLEGADIVSALPDQKERLSSRLFYHIFASFASMPYHMRTERFRILSRRVINRASSLNRTVPYRKAVYADCGLKMDYITYPVIGKNGIGRWHRTDHRDKYYRRRLAIDSLILFTELGYRFSMSMTVIMMLSAVFMMAYSLAAYFIVHPVEGWTTMILFLSFAFFGVFGILTIIVKYLQILVELVFKRKHYRYESIEKLT